MSWACARRLLTMVFASALLPLFGESAVSVSGRVTDETGFRIPGARVSIYLSGRELITTTRTDDHGGFQLALLEFGTYNLKIESLGFTTLWLNVIPIASPINVSLPALALHVSSCGTSSAIEFRLLNDPVEQRSAITGAVVDGRGKSMKAATVDLICPEDRSCATTRTDSTGRFHFVNLLPATYRLRVRRPGYFEDVFEGYVAQAGLDAVYGPASLIACSPGRCQPQFRPERINHCE